MNNKENFYLNFMIRELQTNTDHYLGLLSRDQRETIIEGFITVHERSHLNGEEFLEELFACLQSCPPLTNIFSPETDHKLHLRFDPEQAFNAHFDKELPPMPIVVIQNAVKNIIKEMEIGHEMLNDMGR